MALINQNAHSSIEIFLSQYGIQAIIYD